MSEDAGAQMKSRLRADLLAAMRSGSKSEVTLIRQLVAVIDNAEAPPGQARQGWAPHEFRSGSAEVARLVLSKARVRDLLAKEIREREQAAAEFERLGEVARADTLRAEALVAKRYLD